MAETQPTTVLFADISGSTKLYELRGDVAAVLDRHRVGEGEWPIRQLRLFGQELRLDAAGKTRGTHAPAL